MQRIRIRAISSRSQRGPRACAAPIDAKQNAAVIIQIAGNRSFSSGPSPSRPTPSSNSPLHAAEGFVQRLCYHPRQNPAYRPTLLSLIGGNGLTDVSAVAGRFPDARKAWFLLVTYVSWCDQRAQSASFGAYFTTFNCGRARGGAPLGVPCLLRWKSAAADDKVLSQKPHPFPHRARKYPSTAATGKNTW